MSKTERQVPVLTWLSRREIEPIPSDGDILVYGRFRDTDPDGLVAVTWDYATWVDVVESCTIDFTWWMQIPEPPKEPS